jgi:hypothetical protein
MYCVAPSAHASLLMRVTLPSKSPSLRKHYLTRVFSPLLLCVLTLSACFRAELGRFETPPEIQSLADSASRHLALSVTNPLADSSHGYQFLLFIIPVTRVFPDGLAELVASKLTMYAGFGGNGLHQNQEADPLSPRITAHVESVSVNGYDLLVTRRPSASITLRATLHTRDGLIRECKAHGSFSQFSKFAFEEELRHALDRATDAAARELLECLGLFNARQFEEVHGREIV